MAYNVKTPKTKAVDLTMMDIGCRRHPTAFPNLTRATVYVGISNYKYYMWEMC